MKKTIYCQTPKNGHLVISIGLIFAFHLRFRLLSVVLTEAIFAARNLGNIQIASHIGGKTEVTLDSGVRIGDLNNSLTPAYMTIARNLTFSALSLTLGSALTS